MKQTSLARRATATLTAITVCAALLGSSTACKLLISRNVHQTGGTLIRILMEVLGVYQTWDCAGGWCPRSVNGKVEHRKEGWSPEELEQWFRFHLMKNIDSNNSYPWNAWMEIHGGEMATAERTKEIMNYAAELRDSGCQVLSVVIVRNPFIHAYSDYFHFYSSQYANMSSFFAEYPENLLRRLGVTDHNYFRYPVAGSKEEEYQSYRMNEREKEQLFDDASQFLAAFDLVGTTEELKTTLLVICRFVRYAEPKKKRYPCSRVIDELARDIRHEGYPKPEKVRSELNELQQMYAQDFALSYILYSRYAYYIKRIRAEVDPDDMLSDDTSGGADHYDEVI